MRAAKFFLFLLLTGCAPKCQEGNFWESGYKEFNVNDHEFILTFKEGVVSTMLNATSNAEQGRIMAIRAAELTLENGFNYFDIRRGQTMNEMHIYCYAKEETETAIDATAFLKRYSVVPPVKEQSVKLDI